MSITTLATANKILNQVAAEIGLEPSTDPYASLDPAFIQMRYLLNTCGEELAQSYKWELLIREASIATLEGDSGDYPLPDDFYYMINQTGWERSENVPLIGPLSAQDWSWLLGRDLVNYTIYASFRLNEGLFKIFPQPPPTGLDIHYEYITKNWVSNGDLPVTYTDEVTVGTQIPLYDKTLISRYLKVKVLEAKGFDSTKAQDDFYQTFSFLTGLDKGAEVLSAGGGSYGYRYLDSWHNLPDTGFGSGV
jgi:hypothetical protein